MVVEFTVGVHGGSGIHWRHIITGIVIVGIMNRPVRLWRIRVLLTNPIDSYGGEDLVEGPTTSWGHSRHNWVGWGDSEFFLSPT